MASPLAQNLSCGNRKCRVLIVTEGENCPSCDWPLCYFIDDQNLAQYRQLKSSQQHSPAYDHVVPYGHNHPHAQFPAGTANVMLQHPDQNQNQSATGMPFDQEISVYATQQQPTAIVMPLISSQQTMIGPKAPLQHNQEQVVGQVQSYPPMTPTGFGFAFGAPATMHLVRPYQCAGVAAASQPAAQPVPGQYITVPLNGLPAQLSVQNSGQQMGGPQLGGAAPAPAQYNSQPYSGTGPSYP